MDHLPAGFREVEHTADWALFVWAGNLPALYETAAEGMYALSVARFGHEQAETILLQFSGGDAEDLLVAMLTELLYLGEEKSLGARSLKVLHLDETGLDIEIEAAPILSRVKEIKAVTYHNLAIVQENDLFEVTIVFDV